MSGQDERRGFNRLVDIDPYWRHNLPDNHPHLSPDIVQYISGQESDAGVVDYTFFAPSYPEYLEGISPAERQAALERNEVWHPIERRWVKPGSFKQPSRQYMEKMYNANLIQFILCWDSTYGCYVIDGNGINGKSVEGEEVYNVALLPGWNGANIAYACNGTPELPIGKEYKEVLCSYKHPRFIGFYSYGLTEEIISEYKKKSSEHRITKTEEVPEMSGLPHGSSPFNDAVYDWWEKKWCRPGDHPVPTDIPPKMLRNHQWYIWDTALGVYRAPGDWTSKRWLDNYSSLITDGIVSYGGFADDSMLHFRNALQIYGDKYHGARADGKYADFANSKRAELIEYMRSAS